jgi:hypothetical protein
MFWFSKYQCLRCELYQVPFMHGCSKDDKKSIARIYFAVFAKQKNNKIIPIIFLLCNL